MKQLLIIILTITAFSLNAQSDSIVDPLDSTRVTITVEVDSDGNYIITQKSVLPDKSESIYIQPIKGKSNAKKDLKKGRDADKDDLARAREMMQVENENIARAKLAKKSLAVYIDAKKQSIKQKNLEIDKLKN